MEARSRDISRQRRVGTWQAQVSTQQLPGDSGASATPGRAPPPPQETGDQVHTPLHPKQLTSATGTRASASCSMRPFPWSQDKSVRPRATSSSTETHMFAFLEGGFPREWVVRGSARTGWGQRSGWERRQTQGRPAPHPLGGVLGLLGAEDERELF